jgi:hypothetical protein
MRMREGGLIMEVAIGEGALVVDMTTSQFDLVCPENTSAKRDDFVKGSLTNVTARWTSCSVISKSRVDFA